MDSPVLLEMQADTLLIISCVCEMDMHRKVRPDMLQNPHGHLTPHCHSPPQELFGGYDGVSLLVGYLKRDISKFVSGLGHNRLLLAAVDCVWCAVVGNPVVEDIFLESEGALVLMDVLKVAGHGVLYTRHMHAHACRDVMTCTLACRCVKPTHEH